ncbi:MAG TPA: hypothetical protein VKZ18_26070 [Polyangia bacterium]|nr:hypothetical protein [Polyangia bacterium]
MRSFLALGLLLAMLVALTVTLAPRRHHRRSRPPAEEEDTSTAAAPTPQPPPAERRRPPRPPERPSGPARLYGRVVAPAGEALDLDGFLVAADDGARTINARVSADGAFELHVPPGQYTLEAFRGAWVGLVAGVPARAGAERETTIVLVRSVSLEGTFRAPAGASVTVKVSPTGRADWDDGAVVGDSGFEADHLVPGQAYDLSLSGPGLRTATLRSVTAPARDLVVQVDALPTLRGAVGFPSGERCPIAHVGLYAPSQLPAKDEDVEDLDDDDGVVQAGRVGNVDNACRFQLPVPDGASQMILLAVGEGWHLEQPIAVPPTGDPDPVCLNPPCRANPLEGLATVRISLEGAPPGGGVSASLHAAAGESQNVYGCGSNGRACTIEALAPGQALTVRVGSADCARQTREIVLAPGDNRVAVPCQPPPNEARPGQVVGDQLGEPNGEVVGDAFAVH